MKRVPLTDQQREVWREWAKALRSGEYRQARYLLRTHPVDGDEAQLCCLGVLCDQYAGVVDGGGAPDVTRVEWSQNLSFPQCDSFLVERGGQLEALSGSPPDAVRRWAGLNDAATTYFGAANDSWYLSFDQIADLIDHVIEHQEMPETEYEAANILVALDGDDGR